MKHDIVPGFGGGRRRILSAQTKENLLSTGREKKMRESNSYTMKATKGQQKTQKNEKHPAEDKLRIGRTMALKHRAEREKEKKKNAAPAFERSSSMYDHLFPSRFSSRLRSITKRG
jgi:hypothetical protein